MPRDSTFSSTFEEDRFLKLHDALMKCIAKEYNCHLEEVVRLSIIYYKFQLSNKNTKKGMKKSQFTDFLHSSLDMTDSEMNYYITSVSDRKRNSSPTYFLDSWLRLMLKFIKGNMSDKIDHCFRVYDRYHREKITKADVKHFLSETIYEESPEFIEDSVKEFTDIVVKKMDHDRDGVISLADFTSYCLKHELGFESLGQCWPSREAVSALYATVSYKPGVKY